MKAKSSIDVSTSNFNSRIGSVAFDLKSKINNESGFSEYKIPSRGSFEDKAQVIFETEVLCSRISCF